MAGLDLDHLNPVQRQAVEYGLGPMLVLAGAGSGKTRVLTHRLAHLIATRQADPSQVFAVTFTNKAAAEMRGRVQSLLFNQLGLSLRDDEIWVSTFHSACVRILRSDIHHLGYDNQFTIYDDGDQLSVVKATMKELNISESSFNPKLLQGRINKVKNEGKDHETYRPSYGGPAEDAFIRVFERYADVLKTASALDFADLILKTVQLYEQHPRVLKAYQDRFQHLMIDEYQDTNRCQYQLMKLLAGERANICAVGDEDQSIYKWRGADINNILNFEKDYPNTKIFKLEQNYRSTKNIIEASSHVIGHNTERREKQLWTDNTEGEKILSIEAYDEHDEADKVINEIGQQIDQGVSANEMAIFYRTNAQSRLLEDRLRSKGINYQIYGGLKFYARLEVKDALAYMKLLSNPKDDVSFRRVVNVPPRGIGAVSLKKFSEAALDNQLSHFGLLEAAFGSQPTINLNVGRSTKNFKKFYDLMAEFKETKDKLLPSDLLNFVLTKSGYKDNLSTQDSVEAQTRLENLAELRQSIVEYELRCGAENPDDDISLEKFLEEIALVSDIDRFDANEATIKLMTMHSAKGLEFNRVFIVGLEEELFPNIRSWEGEDQSDIEEERRLFYVGMTRAKQKLYLLHAKNRTVFGNPHFRVVSRFMEEIPEYYVEVKKADYFSRRRHYRDRPGLPPRDDDSGFGSPGDDNDDFSQVGPDDDFDSDMSAVGPAPGSPVEHPVFGPGKVRKILGNDRVMVEFPGRGHKKLSWSWLQDQSPF